jgi:hypothetical protein
MAVILLPGMLSIKYNKLYLPHLIKYRRVSAACRLITTAFTAFIAIILLQHQQQYSTVCKSSKKIKA